VTKKQAIYSLLNNFDDKITRSEGTSDEQHATDNADDIKARKLEVIHTSVSGSDDDKREALAAATAEHGAAVVKLKDENGGYLVVYHSEDRQSVLVRDHDASENFATKEIPYDNLIAMIADGEISQLSAESQQASNQLSGQKNGWAVQHIISTEDSQGAEPLKLDEISAWRTGGKTMVSQQSIIAAMLQSQPEQTLLDTLTTSTAIASLAMVLGDYNRYVKADELAGTKKLHQSEMPNEKNMEPFFESMSQRPLTPAKNWDEKKTLHIASSRIDPEPSKPGGLSREHKQRIALEAKIGLAGPVIVNVATKNNVTGKMQSFFVVLDAISRENVTVRNPTSGAIEQIATAEFMKYIQWDSAVIQLEKPSLFSP
jgi:hypothetical protein